jgi:cytochrome P450
MNKNRCYYQDALVDARDPESGEVIDDQLVQDECLTFLLAGNNILADLLIFVANI